MNARVYICGDVKFPRGDAASNYVEYLALAFTDAGYKTQVLAVSKNITIEETGVQNGIEYFLFPYASKNVISKFQNYIKAGKDMGKKLVTQGLNSNDIVVVYTTNYVFLKSLYSCIKMSGAKMASCVVEWHQAFQYKYQYFNPEFWLNRFCFLFGYKKTKNVFAISKCLEQIFKKQGCNVLRIPILANPYEYRYSRKEHEKLQFIVSGNAGKKDKLENMLEAFNSLSDEELANIKIHLTGMSANNAQRLLEKCTSKVKAVAVVHKWMDYNELIDLYREMDFLLICRPVNKVTLANFPSKVPEMMSFGVIPVVSKVGDYTEIYLNAENAIVFEGDSCQDCENAIKKVFSIGKDKKKEMESKARQLVENEFAYDKWSAKLKQFMETQ